MISDKEIKKRIKNPMYGLSYGKVCQIYGADLEWEDRGNCCYRLSDMTVILGNGARSEDLCHELAHHLQYKCGAAPDRDNFQEIIAFERQAERIAYYLHKQHFYFRHHAKFNAYIPQWHKDFLWEWWYGDPSPYLIGVIYEY